MNVLLVPQAGVDPPGQSVQQSYEPNTNEARDITIRIDRRLHCPLRWVIDMQCDFTARRYSRRGCE